MALDNFENLKASIESWSHREDIKTVIDDFIQIAETEMYSNPDASLRIRSMEQTAIIPTVVTNSFITLPAGFLNARRIDISIDGILRTLKYKTPEELNIDETRSGVPNFFTVSGDSLLFELLPDDVYDVTVYYFGKLPALSDANPVNDILTNHPNIYLYGSLRALFQWARNREEEDLNYNRFIKGISGANITDRKGRYGPVPVQRIRGATP